MASLLGKGKASAQGREFDRMRRLLAPSPFIYLEELRRDEGKPGPSKCKQAKGDSGSAGTTSEVLSFWRCLPLLLLPQPSCSRKQTPRNKEQQVPTKQQEREDRLMLHERPFFCPLPAPSADLSNSFTENKLPCVRPLCHQLICT